METSIMLVIQKLLGSVVEYNASDMHLSVGNPPTLRVNGQLVPLNNEQVIQPEFTEEFAGAILSKEEMEYLKAHKEIITAHDFENKARFRAHIFYQQGYLSISLRFISDAIRTLEDIGLPEPVLNSFINIKKGLIIFTGSFGSGKSSTLAAFINTMNNTKGYHIVTIENPVEYLYSDNKSIIQQREIHKDVESFEAALDSITKEDIDVVAVSEITNTESLIKMMEVADADRLVLATTTASTVVKAIERIIQDAPQDKQQQIRSGLANVLAGVIAQKLVGGIDGSLKLVVESFIPDTTGRAIIKDGSLYQLNNIIQTSRGDGIRSFDFSLYELVRDRKISAERGLQHAADPISFRQMLHI